VGAVALVGEWWLEHRDWPREQVAAHIVNLLWHGLRGLKPDPVDRYVARRARAARSAGADRGDAREDPGDAAAREPAGSPVEEDVR